MLKITKKGGWQSVLLGSALLALTFLVGYIYSLYSTGYQIIPQIYFWLAAVAFAASIASVCIFTEINGRSIAIVLVASLIISSFFFLRFYFYGQDLMGELYVAQVTYALGRWPADRIGYFNAWLQTGGPKVSFAPQMLDNEYFSTTSVTILPSVISQITGAPVIFAFKLLLPIVSAALVTVVFLIGRNCFDRKIGIISCMIFLFNIEPPTLLRQDVALLFFLLAAFVLLRGNDKTWSFIALMFSSSIAMAHYAMFYFALFGLLSLLAAKKVWNTKLLRDLVKKNGFENVKNISNVIVLYFIVAGFVWLSFIAYPVFSRNLGSAAETMRALLGVGHVEPSTFQRTAIFSSLGTFNTAVQWLGRILAVFGILLIFRSYLSSKKFAFTIFGAGLILLLVLFAVLPDLSLSIDLNRVLAIALAGFSTFIAVSLVRIMREGRRLGQFLGVIVIVLIFLETIHIPILYSVPSSMTQTNYAFNVYQVVKFYEPSDFSFANWANGMTRSCAIFASDSSGQNIMYLANRTSFRLRVATAAEAIPLIEEGRTNYFVAVFYVPSYLEYDSGASGHVSLNSGEATYVFHGAQMNSVYSDSRTILFYYVDQSALSC